MSTADKPATVDQTTITDQGTIANRKSSPSRSSSTGRKTSSGSQRSSGSRSSSSSKRSSSSKNSSDRKSRIDQPDLADKETQTDPAAFPRKTAAQVLKTIIAEVTAYVSGFPNAVSKATQTDLKGVNTSVQVSEDDLESFIKSRSKPSPKQSPSPSPDSKKVRKGRITKRWNEKPKRINRCKGLVNSYGVSCYRNATLQCLFNMPEFVAYLDGIHNLEDCPSHQAAACVVCALKQLLSSYSSTRYPTIAKHWVTNFEAAIENSIPEWHPMSDDIVNKRQGDPFVFLQYLLDELKSLEVADQNPNADDLFKMDARTEWTCEECGHIEKAEGDRAAPAGGIGLILNIQKPSKGLRMTTYMTHSEFSTTPKVRCESEECEKKHGTKIEGFDRTKTKYIIKAPEILVIQLNRITTGRYNAKSGKLDEIKVRDDVKFEEYVNLGEFTESGAPIMYQLQGVVAHMGSTRASGHYIAGVRKPDGKCFCSINDSRSIESARGGGMDELRMPLSMHSQFDPYVLFYSKV